VEFPESAISVVVILINIPIIVQLSIQTAMFAINADILRVFAEPRHEAPRSSLIGLKP